MPRIYPFRSNHLYLFGLVLLVCGLPVSFFLTSLSQFFLAASFFLEGNFVEKFRRYFRNKPALIITGILLLHVIGLAWTTDLTEGLKDIRIKLPLLILPVIIGGSEPVSKKNFQLVIGFFIAAVVTGTLISTAVLTGVIHREITDIREIFIFHVSHIRFALFICISFFSLLYFIFSNNGTQNLFLKFFFILVAVWLLVFLVIMESMTGIIITSVTGFCLLVYLASTVKNKFRKIILIVMVLAIPVSGFVFIRSIAKQYYITRDMPVDGNAKTPAGNAYTFDTSGNLRENGYLVWIYVCEKELREEWDSRSRFKYDSLDERHQPVKYTLVRFLASKGWKKDGEAVKNLSPGEVRSIEKGVANESYQHLSDFRSRVLKTIWEYEQFKDGGELNGHSVMQRFEFWKAACGIIAAHPFTGVGTGDMPAAYREQYVKMNSRLSEKFRLRAHNQYLSVAVALGFFSLAYFLFALVAPMIITQRYKDYFYMVFWTIAILSMVTEDTLETQTGATFFAFFSCLFLFRDKPDIGHKV
ncbi:MAG: O-antigen ligase family protein [Bacteroidetes bacterium]|nr:O-antigen ligase family protein [Bacteroidota bacterium]